MAEELKEYTDQQLINNKVSDEIGEIIESKNSDYFKNINYMLKNAYDQIEGIRDMLSQIDGLKLVPHDNNDPNSFPPALKQFFDNGETFKGMLNEVNESLLKSAAETLLALTFLRNITKIQSKKEALKVDPETGQKVYTVLVK